LAWAFTGASDCLNTEAWAERAYAHNLIHFNQLDRDGHFAAWEQPQLFSQEMRASFQALRWRERTNMSPASSSAYKLKG
jgi:hypothetical protein